MNQLLLSAEWSNFMFTTGFHENYSHFDALHEPEVVF